MTIASIFFIVNERGQSQGAISGRHHTNPKLKPFRESVGWQALEARNKSGMHEPAAAHTPIRLELDFYFERPASVPATELFPTHGHIPDLDHLQRAVSDSLAGIMYENDRDVVDCHSRKWYGKPRCEITVRLAATEGVRE